MISALDNPDIVRHRAPMSGSPSQVHATLSEFRSQRAEMARQLEDEMLIAFTLADMLKDLGCTSEVASRATKALVLATAQTFDVGILDVNLAGESAYAVADALALRGIPFIIATGYGPEGIEASYRGHPVLPKPYFPQQVEAALLKVLTPSGIA